MSIRTDFRHTMRACYIGSASQAIVTNLVPLLFLTFQRTYDIPLDKIALMVALNFGIQLLVDFVSAHFVDRIGYRTSAVAAHLFILAGLAGLAFLPDLLPSPYAGLLLSVVLYAIGSGLIEVIISPIAEACPTENKSASMSLLHSFYCWGSVLVIALSTLYFTLAGIENWRLLVLLWAVVPALNALYFSQVPLRTLTEGTEPMPIGGLLRTRLFWVLALLMVCAGAAEQAMSQWASAFAESGLGVSKTIGDLAGPCLFALLMGLSRVLYAKFSDKLDLTHCMLFCGVLCISSYLLAVFSPLPVFALLGCGLCGLSVGILWPGTFSLSARECPRGGTALFALLALAGDLGCSAGPALVGFVSGALADSLKAGLLSAVIFPVLLLVGIFLLRRLARPKVN